ncbi:MAG: hypothetical protein ACKKL4_00735 [Patescibacteria group bacterium]
MNDAHYLKLEKLFELTTDVANTRDEKDYKKKLKGVPSNTFGDQLWCILGARESYLRVLQTGNSFVFSCSIDNRANKLQMMKSLFESSRAILDWLEQNNLDSATLPIILNILEHEAQHHGQLIRYFYGNRWIFPQSWKDYYRV